VMQAEFPDPFLYFVPLLLLGLAPFFVIMVTSFTKLVVVFSLMRQALGIQQVPPNLVINGLAIVISIFIMAPVGMDIADAMRTKSLPRGERIKLEQMFEMFSEGKEPLRQFLLKQTKDRERKAFVDFAQKLWPEKRSRDVKDDDLLILVPAFAVSELTAAFQIGFMLYLAFVVIDLVVANVLLAMGMSMVSPTVVSIPFKLLLFVLLDGLSLLIHGLVQTYR
jgi:type III secretion protein R